MKRSKNLSKKRAVQLSVIVILCFALLWSCNSPGPSPSPTPTPEPPVQQLQRGPQTFLHLKIDSAKLVNTFYKAHGNFKKIVFDFIVTDFRIFPDSLRMAAYGVQGNGNDLFFCNPLILDTVMSGTTIRTEQVTDSVLFATQEITRQSLKNIVGNDGEGYPTGGSSNEAYDYLLFIPTRLDSCGRVYLRYAVRAIKRGVGGGASGSGVTNPCPPNKPE